MIIIAVVTHCLRLRCRSSDSGPVEKVDSFTTQASP